MNKLKKNKCSLCGDEFYKKVETPDMGWVKMCKGCYESYMGCENCNPNNHLISNGRNMDYHIDIFHKKDIVIRDESKTLTGKGSEFRKRDPNRMFLWLVYATILLPIILIVIWIILEAIGFIKRV